MDTAARLLRLLTLLQTRPHWPGDELAARLAVTVRTVRRDVVRLRSLGYPVGAEGVLVRAAANELEPLLRFAICLPFAFEVLHPPELRQRVHDLGARLTAHNNPPTQ